MRAYEAYQRKTDDLERRDDVADGVVFALAMAMILSGLYAAGVATATLMEYGVRALLRTFW